MSNGICRRELLAEIGTLAASGAAGCTSAFQPRTTRIGEVILLNMDETPHTVHLRIEAGDETVFDTTRDVPASDEPQPVLTQSDGLPTERARYTVIAERSDDDETLRRTLPGDANGDCYSVTVRIGADGTIRDVPTDGTSATCE